MNFNSTFYKHLAVITMSIGGLIYLMQNCGQRNGSSVDSLENFASNSNLRENSCFGDPEKDFEGIYTNIEVQDEALRMNLGQELTLALTALPQEMLDAMAALRVKFLVTASADEICRNKEMSQSEIGVSCTVGVPDQLAKTNNASELSGYTIVIAADPQARYIKHLTIRSVGHFFSQEIAQRFLSIENGDIQFSPDKFADLQGLLTLSFLADVVDSNGLFDLNSFERHLGENATAQVEENFQRLREGESVSPFDGIEKDLAGMSNFTTELTADSFDSYHCMAAKSIVNNRGKREQYYNPEIVKELIKTKDKRLFGQLLLTREIMKDFFPKTYRQFLAVNDYLMDLARRFAKEKIDTRVTAESSSPGFGLRNPSVSEAQRKVRDARQALYDYKEQLDRSSTWYKPNTWFGARMGYNTEARADNRVELNNLRRRVLLAEQELSKAKNQKPKSGLGIRGTALDQETSFDGEGYVEGLEIGKRALGQEVYATGTSLGNAKDALIHGYHEEGLRGVGKEARHVLGGAYHHTADQIAADLAKADNERRSGLISGAGYYKKTFDAWVNPLPFVGAANQSINNVSAVITDQPISAEEIANRQSKAAVQATTDALAGAAAEGLGSVAARATSGLTKATSRGLLATGNSLGRATGTVSNGFVRQVGTAVSTAATGAGSAINYTSSTIGKLLHGSAHGAIGTANDVVVGGTARLLTRGFSRVATGTAQVVEKLTFEGSFHEAINHAVHGAGSLGGHGHASEGGHGSEEDHGVGDPSPNDSHGPDASSHKTGH